jgi:hypothetical protein
MAGKNDPVEEAAGSVRGESRQQWTAKGPDSKAPSSDTKAPNSHGGTASSSSSNDTDGNGDAEETGRRGTEIVLEKHEAPSSGQHRPKEYRVRGMLDRSLQAQLGRQLRAIFTDVANEPVPKRFIALLEELAAREKGR